ncbi:MFS transporter [Serratia fonticola]|uniref:MFS transporter n=1 Tax=Serratia fonticola TaxID=47917 RepID=UPI003BB78CC4
MLNTNPAPSSSPTVAGLVQRFWPLYIALFFVGAEMYVVAPLLGNISSDLSISIAAAAQLVTAYVIVQAVCGPFIGLLYNKLGPRSMIVTGLLVFTAGNVLSANVHDYWLVLGSRSIAGLGVAFFGPAAWTWMSHTVEEHLRGRAVANGMAAFALGQVLGVPIGAFTASFFSWRVVVAGLGVATLFLIPAVWRKVVLHDSFVAKLTSSSGVSRPNMQWLRVLIIPWQNKTLRLSYTATFFFHAASLGAYTFLATRLIRDFALTETLAGMTGILSGVGTLLGAMIAGQIADKKAHSNQNEIPSTLLVFWTLGAIVAIPLALGAPWLWLTVFAVFAWFVFSGAFDSNQQDSVIRLSGENAASSLSWNTSTLYAASASGVWIMSIAPENSKFIATVALVLALLSAGAALRLRKMVRS